MFNVLSGVVSLVRAGESQVSAELLTKLSGLLRESFRDDAPAFPTLDEELAFLSAYLELEGLRFGERLQVEVEVSPETRAARVPSRMFLPAVENAIKHGLCAREGSFRLRLEGRVEAGCLEFRVSDDGPGLAPDTVWGTGWNNTQKRLMACYGERASWTQGASEWGAAALRFRIPLDGSEAQA